jgi:hypothetical protein
MNRAEQAMIRQLETNADAFEKYFESGDMPLISKTPANHAIGNAPAKGNPVFSAQFDLSILVKYFTRVTATGICTAVTGTTVDPSLRVPLPAFIFGLSDYRGGFTKARTIFPVTNWLYQSPAIIGKDDISYLGLDANAMATLQNGDLIIPYIAAAPGSGTTSIAVVIIRTTQVAYGTLLNSLTSDKFIMNMIRYTVPDTTAQSLDQFSNQILVAKQSLFGKFDSDSISPNSYKVPEQNQISLIDIPLKKGIDKSILIGTYLNNDLPSAGLLWSTFVWSVKTGNY